MSKKPDYSHINEPQLRKFCTENDLRFVWKNDLQGHAVIFNYDTECYVWIQRMVIELRKKDGVFLAKPQYFRGNNIFNARTFSNIFFGSSNSVVPNSKMQPKFREGVVVSRIKEGSTFSDRDRVVKKAKYIAAQHSTLYP